jgi:hypothetical protein
MKDFTTEELKWGDEVEFFLVEIDRANSSPRVMSNAYQIVEVMRHFEQEHGGSNGWNYEYSNFHVEAIPGAPYTS